MSAAVSLHSLYEFTLTHFGRSTGLTRALVWVDAVVPVFAAACRHALHHEPESVLLRWRDWVQSEAFEVIQEAGHGELFAWRRQWLMCLLETTLRLQRTREVNAVSEEQDKLCKSLWQEHRNLPPCFPPAFWQDLLGQFCAPSPLTAPAPVCRVTFPLVLSDPVIDRGRETPVLLAQFEFTPAAGQGGQLFLDPHQAALRCLDASFAGIFPTAARQAAHSASVSPADLPPLRVRITLLCSEQERFLSGMVLRGASAEGTLALGAAAVFSGKTLRSAPFAVSFALGAENSAFCLPVGGAEDKVRGCAKQGVSYLLVAASQQQQLGLAGYRQQVDIVGVASLAEAMEWASPSASMPALPAASHSVVFRPEPARLLESFEGPVPLTSPYYIAREADAEFHAGIRERHSVLLVKGARQVGKSSLLARGMAQAEHSGYRVVETDFQKLSHSDLASLQTFYCALGDQFAQQLGLENSLEARWVPGRSPNLNFEGYVEDALLSAPAPLVWFIEEADRLFFGVPFSSDVFGLLRSWANARQSRPHSSWQGLTLVIAYATEAHLFIHDLNQSPFNIGTRFDLQDFSVHEMADLNERYGTPLAEEMDLAQLYALVGGHPYLARRSLGALKRTPLSLPDFEEVALREDGPVGDHLRRLLTLLLRRPENVDAVKAVLQGQPCPGYETLCHLRSGGVLVGDSVQTARLRCHLYQRFLTRHLL